MKNFINEKTRITGLMVQLSALDTDARELWAFNQFKAYAHKNARYVAERHDMSVEYCEGYVTSGLYFKFLELRNKAIEDADGVHYNAVEYCACRHVLALVRKVVNNLNFVGAGTYENISAWASPSFSIGLPSGAVYSVSVIDHKAHTELNKPDIISTRRVDIVDLVEQWENREARKARRNERRFYTSTDDEGGQCSELDRVSGNYGTPETILLNKCARIRARRVIEEIKLYKNGARLLEIAGKKERKEALSGAERVALNLFRSHHILEEKFQCIAVYTEFMEASAEN